VVTHICACIHVCMHMYMHVTSERVATIEYLPSCRPGLSLRHRVLSWLPPLECLLLHPSYSYCTCSTHLDRTIITDSKYSTIYQSKLHHTTPHYTTPHHTTLHYTALHYTTLHYTTPHHTTPHYTALHYTTLHYTTLH
jgi:hypothetical protein